MARLFEDEAYAAARQRLDFLRARIGRRLPFEDMPGAEPAATLGRVRALTEAAALAFATDEASIGREHLELAVRQILALPPERRPLLRLALLGALAGLVEVRLGPEEVELRAPELDLRSTHRLDAVDPRQAGALLAAALVTGQRGEAVRLLLPEAWGGDADGPAVPRLVLALAYALEAGVLPWFAPDRPGWAQGAAHGTLHRLEERWRLELRAMLRHEERRSLMILPGSVVDWSLLAIRRALDGDREWTETARRFDVAEEPESFHAALVRERPGWRDTRA